MTYRSIMLLGAALAPFASPAVAQQTVQTAPSSPAPTTTAPPAAAPSTDPALDDEEGDDAIVITGSRARGSAIGDIPPENTLDSRDVRATGATNISDLLDALAPQIGSAQGRGGEQPLLLLNGLRISSFRELRGIPTEAIERVDILPEEVALKYGSRPDQKVVNIVLRQRFRSTAVQLGAGGATDGGYVNELGDLTRFMVNRNGRTTINLHAEGNGMLTEAERDIIPDTSDGGAPEDLAARSLVGTKRDVRASATVNRQIFGDVSATINGEVEHTNGLALIGVGQTLIEPLSRKTSTDTAHLGSVLNGTKGNWRWTVTGTGDLARNVTSTLRDELAEGSDRGITTTVSGEVKGTANGNLFSVPAGDASATFTLDANTVHLDSERQRLSATTTNSLSRTTGEAAVNLDLPISRRGRGFSALGNLSLNGNAEVDQLSDFGTLTTIGAGVNWSPVNRLNLLASWTREEGPPSIDQLGDPVLNTPGSRIFDFSTGQTVLANAITGGNPDLQSDRRHVVKVGANWQPFPNTDLRLRAEYVHQTIDNAIQSLTVTPTIEEAFPDRFVRDSSGQLVSVDLRPVNFASTRNDTMRIGFDFSKPLKSHRPSQSVIDQMRAQFRAAAGGTSPTPARPATAGAAAVPPGTPPSAAPATAGGTASPPGGAPQSAAANDRGGGSGGPGGFRGGGGGRGGGFFGGGNRGRLTFSLTDNITFVNEAIIAAGLPVVDYLHGDASGANGGTPRHKIQAQTGYFNNGIGARLTSNWSTGTVVNTLTGDELHFSPLATFDLRLFANPGDIPEVAIKHPWLRGSQVQLQVSNIFNSRPDVRNGEGIVPISYQPDLLDPLGRTIMISFRKLFYPSPRAMMRQRQQDMQSNPTPPPPPEPAAAPPTAPPATSTP